MEYLPTFIDQLDVDYISHHGIKGMHWGVRRYQNADGSLTPAGRKRYDETKKLMRRADSYESAAKHLNSQIHPNKSRIERARIMTQAVKAQQKADRIRSRLDPDIVSKIEQDRKIELKKKQEAKEKEWNNSPSSRRHRFMDDAMHEVFGANTKSDYRNLYREMSKDKRFKNLLDSEDNDDYKEAEAAWLKKHGYWESYLDAIHNGYKDI